MDFRTKLKKFFHNRWATICRRWHYVAVTIPFLVATAGIVFTVFSIVRINQVLDGQSFQYRAEYYGSKAAPYRHVTVLSKGLEQNDLSAPRAMNGGLNLEAYTKIHEALDLTEKSGNSTGNRSQSLSGNADTLWMDCYSSTAFYPVNGFVGKELQGSVPGCEIVGVGGAYGTIHPFRYESGGFLETEMNNSYTAVLNTQLAWNLFHSYDVLGMTVEIGGIRYDVVGVVCEGDDEIAEATDVTKPRAYVYFPELAKLINRSSMPTAMNADGDKATGVKKEDLAITSYEALLADPIKNIAYNDLIKALTDTIGYSKDTCTTLEIINNTGRFNVLRLKDKFFPLKSSVSPINGITVPYQERSARLAEQYVLFWAEVLIVSGIALITGLGGVYCALHGRKTKHEIIYVDEEEQPLEIRRV
ncbi:MAG: ABC transporter permease [Clostridiales bacterium]|nr:ABC transporter permease [Clostridiales bacterium]